MASPSVRSRHSFNAHPYTYSSWHLRDWQYEERRVTMRATLCWTLAPDSAYYERKREETAMLRDISDRHKWLCFRFLSSFYLFALQFSTTRAKLSQWIFYCVMPFAFTFQQHVWACVCLALRRLSLVMSWSYRSRKKRYSTTAPSWRLNGALQLNRNGFALFVMK